MGRCVAAFAAITASATLATVSAVAVAGTALAWFAAVRAFGIATVGSGWCIALCVCAVGVNAFFRARATVVAATTSTA